MKRWKWNEVVYTEVHILSGPQMIPGGVGPMLVQQQTSSGVQLILRSPPPQHTTKQPTVVLSNGPQPTVLVQHNPSRAQAQPQLVRLVTGQTLQLQHIQTSSGPALIAVPAPTTPTPPPQPSSPKNKLKKKKKKEDEGPTRLDLANLMKLSGMFAQCWGYRMYIIDNLGIFYTLYFSVLGILFF